MDRNLFRQALIKFTVGLLIVAALLFISAGTFDYMQGWLFIGVLFVPMFCAGLIMIRWDPELLRKRLSAKEEQAEQKEVIRFSALMFLAAFIVAGLTCRFEWLLPEGVSYAAAVVFLTGYILYAEVMRENAYLSRTVEVREGQKVIDTGLYGIVRHPMYMSTLVMFLAMPLVLGSFFSFLIMLLYIPIINKRISNEEEVLEEGLEGYREYKERVRYKVIPLIW